MKRIKIKNISKQIICIIIVLMLCNFIVPKKIYATEIKAEEGPIFNPFAKFITFFCDGIMQILQDEFKSTDSIKKTTGGFNFQYSPATIFSGEILAFDINFIKPNEENAVSEVKKNDYFTEEYIRTILSFGYGGSSSDETRRQAYNEAKRHKYSKITMDLTSPDNTPLYATAYYWTDEDNKNHIECRYYDTVNYTNTYYSYSEEIKEVESLKYESIALKLQPIIATWYKALRRIALVGLLSVLVYVGIKTVLSSSSTKAKGKYKKMLADWLIALCLLFTMHYIMNMTLAITKQISNIFNTGETDQLLNIVRGEIEKCSNWKESTTYLIMYVVMTIYTITFTVQYLKRVLYMGFFTLIAPLVTLTYPLDKINDSKAQAFTMWMREYIFNALIQVVHLAVYYILISSALSLVETYPLYAIVVLGFMTQTESIIRKMFGFNNVETVGTFEAAVAGGLASTAMKKIQSLSKSSKSEDKKSESNKVRTTQNDKPITLNSGKGANVEIAKQAKVRMEQTGSGSNTKPELNLRSAATTLYGKYSAKAGTAVMKTLLGASGAFLGFAKGVAEGDISNAFKSGAAGFGAGNALVNLGQNAVKNAKQSFNDMQDTWNEGAYGAEYAQKLKDVREFKQTKEYKELKKEFGNKLSDEKLSEILEAASKQQEES